MGDLLRHSTLLLLSIIFNIFRFGTGVYQTDKNLVFYVQMAQSLISLHEFVIGGLMLIVQQVQTTMESMMIFTGFHLYRTIVKMTKVYNTLNNIKI